MDIEMLAPRGGGMMELKSIAILVTRTTDFSSIISPRMVSNNLGHFYLRK